MPRGGPQTRSFERFRAIAACRTCGRERDGTTTVERRPWGSTPPRSYHFCDECCEQVEERFLEVVLLEYLA